MAARSRSKRPRSPMVGVLFVTIAAAAIVVARWSTEAAFGVLGGVVCAIVLAAIVLSRFPRLLLSRARIAALFGGVLITTVAIVAAIDGTTAAIGAGGALIGVSLELAGFDWLNDRGDRKKLEAIARAIDRGDDPAALLDALPGRLLYRAARELAASGRWRELAAWFDRIAPAGQRSAWFITWQVTARLALGEIDAARAALAAAGAASTPTDRELVDQDRARIEIAEGDAAGVLERFGEEPLADSGPDLRWSRLLIRADALYVTGDPDAARALLDRVREALGDDALAQVKVAKRPVSALL